MSVPSSGAIGLNANINTTFGATAGTSLASYAGKGGSYMSLYYNPSATVPPISSSGPIGMAQFYGTQFSYFYTNGSAAIDLGAYNIAPWSSNAPGGDTTARYIWNIANANVSAPGGIWIHFYKLFNNTTAFTGTLYVNCDNYCYVLLNGKPITSSAIAGGNPNFSTVTSIPITIPAGLNMLDIYCENAGSADNPAGLVGSLYNGSTMVLHTDSTWKYYTTSMNLNALVVQYSCRLINPFYTGAIFNIRRSSDNVTSDFYTDFTQSFVGTSSTGGTSLTSWLNGATGYVTKWYDQSGYANNAVQATNANQPTMAQQSGFWVIQFQNANSTYLSISTPVQPKTVVCHFWNNNATYGSIITTAYDYEVRFTGGTSITNGNTDVASWYYMGTLNGGTNLSYNNNASATSVLLSAWNYLCLSVTTPSWSNAQTGNVASFFTRIGTDGYSPSARGLNGYMTEMICHNTTITTTDINNFYRSRMF